jgi:hypothetical protein
MYLAVLAYFAAEADEHLRVYDGSRADSHIILDHGMRADQTAIADVRAGSDDTVGPEKNALAEGGFRMHDGGRMTFPPLGETTALFIEVFEESRHAHGDAVNGEAARIALIGRIDGPIQLGADD